jgi:hypothetical protein
MTTTINCIILLPSYSWEGGQMNAVTTWLPLALGGVIVIVISYKVFTDKNVTNYLGYGLIAALGLCALPSITHITASKGDVQFSADLQTVKGSVASQSADVQGQVTLLSKKMDTIISKLNATADIQAQITPAYKQNSLNQILVYYATSAQAEANKIRDFLLDSGYRSSASFTDYQELSLPLPTPGTVRVVHTDSSGSVDLANLIRSKLQQKFPELRQITDQKVSKLSSGDIQIQLF